LGLAGLQSDQLAEEHLRAPVSGQPDLECPVAATARVLGARWTIQILYQLAQPMRFCELQDAVGGVNPRTLTQRLRFLRDEGLLGVELSGGAVRYGLSSSGAQLVPVLASLREWQKAWLADRRLRAFGAPLVAQDGSYETQDPSANHLFLRSAGPQPT